MKARKRPIVVDFYEPTDPEVQKYIKDGKVMTLEGEVELKYYKDGYIIVGVDGEAYPIRRDIFDKTYAVLDDEVNL